MKIVLRRIQSFVLSYKNVLIVIFKAKLKKTKNLITHTHTKPGH